MGTVQPCINCCIIQVSCEYAASIFEYEIVLRLGNDNIFMALGRQAEGKEKNAIEW